MCRIRVFSFSDCKYVSDMADSSLIKKKIMYTGCNSNLPCPQAHSSKAEKISNLWAK